MKKFFVCAAMFAAMCWMVSCGDSNDDANAVSGESSLQGAKCDEEKDKFTCEQNDTNLLKCKEGKWELHEVCEKGQKCDAKAGKCGKTEEENNEEENNEEQTGSCGNNWQEDGEVCDGGSVECKSLDASLAGFAKCKADCSGYDTSSCTSGGNGGGNGGDNGGNSGGKSECLLLAECWANCQDDACVNNCVDNYSSAQNDFMPLYNCIMNSQTCQALNCQECINEYNSCANAGGGNGGGNGGGQTDMNCGDTFRCMINCNGDQTCQQTCVQNSTSTAQGQLSPLIQCVNANGSSCQSATSLQAYIDCLAGVCPDQAANCEGF